MARRADTMNINPCDIIRKKRFGGELTEQEIRAFFLPMAQATGTLWENMTDFASCNHGFASHVAYWLNKMY